MTIVKIYELDDNSIEQMDYIDWQFFSRTANGADKKIEDFILKYQHKVHWQHLTGVNYEFHLAKYSGRYKITESYDSYNGLYTYICKNGFDLYQNRYFTVGDESDIRKGMIKRNFISEDLLMKIDECYYNQIDFGDYISKTKITENFYEKFKHLITLKDLSRYCDHPYFTVLNEDLYLKVKNGTYETEKANKKLELRIQELELKIKSNNLENKTLF